MFPTRTMGWIVATATMVFSLVILALPVGVIGGNFSNAWSNYESEKNAALAERERDKKYITAAIQRIEPFDMSKMMMVEVWNERCPTQRPGASGQPVWGPAREITARPDVAEFMGMVNLTLELPEDSATVQTHTLQLKPLNQANVNGITGSITVKYEWTPLPMEPHLCQPEPSKPKEDPDEEDCPTLRGRLKVTIIGADNLVKMTYNRSGKSCSNPYAMVFLYPNSPVAGEEYLVPGAWRTYSEPNTLGPRWNASNTWEFVWVEPPVDSPRMSPRSPRSPRGPSPGEDSEGAHASIHPMSTTGDSEDPVLTGDVTDADVLKELQRFGRSVIELREQVKSVGGRIIHKIPNAQPGEPFAPPGSDR
jgi:hypothetical protein